MTTYRHNQYRYFYDTHVKMWTVVLLDSENNQIGHAEYFGNRQQLVTNYPEFKFIKE